MNMIDELARAAWDENLRIIPPEMGVMGMGWDEETEGLRENWRAFTRAMLVRMREPTGKMLEAGFDDYPSIWTAGITPADRIGIWQAMIDAALDAP